MLKVPFSQLGPPHLRGWRHTVEIVVFEILNSMKLYPSVVHAYTNKMRPAIRLFLEPNKRDEVSNRIQPPGAFALRLARAHHAS